MLKITLTLTLTLTLTYIRQPRFDGLQKYRMSVRTTRRPDDAKRYPGSPRHFRSVAARPTLTGGFDLPLAASYYCSVVYDIGVDLHRAVVATVARENWTRRTISSLFSCRKLLHLFLGKSTETAAIRAALHFLTPINMHRIICRLGLCARPH